MKIATYFFLIPLFTTMVAEAQSEPLTALVKKGIEFHDRGAYGGAIEVYKEALRSNPNSSMVHYEMALTYLSLQEYEKSEDHSRTVLKLNNGNLLEATIALGNVLDLQGKQKQALKVYEKGLKRFEHYLLYYNHAIACLNTDKIDKAYDSILKAIQSNPEHASSHLVLSKIMDRKNSRIKAMLPLYYFLLIEPNTARANIEYETLRGYIDHGVSKESNRKINVAVPFNGDSDFGAAEMMVSLVKSSENLAENQGKSELELFALQNEKIFKILGELKKDNKGFWWDVYVPFFYGLAMNNHTDAYSYYISQSRGNEAEAWLGRHPQKIEEFTEWLN